FLERQPEADAVEAGRLLGRVESALEYLLAELLFEQHDVEAGFDGFIAAPGVDAGRGVSDDGILELTGAAYLFGPVYSLWPFHGKLAPHPRESVLCLSSKAAIVPMGELAVSPSASRNARARVRRENEKNRRCGEGLRIPPDPLSWRYVMKTTLP